MKPKAPVVLLLILTACTVVSAAEQTRKVPNQLWQKVQEDGMVRAIVGLNVPTKPDKKLTQDEIIAQRQAIGNAQNRLLKELDGTNHRLSVYLPFFRVWRLTSVLTRWRFSSNQFS